MAYTGGCLTEEQVREFAELESSALSQEEIELMAIHLENCEECKDRAAEFDDEDEE